MRLPGEDLIGGPVEERRICLDRENVNVDFVSVNPKLKCHPNAQNAKFTPDLLKGNWPCDQDHHHW